MKKRENSGNFWLVATILTGKTGKWENFGRWQQFLQENGQILVGGNNFGRKKRKNWRIFVGVRAGCIGPFYQK